ncbi:MAG: hypothetical protein MJK14_08615 [Rivularia sp. ALOHA_DT_140]|nr:hypothetical protein [Rivularia sp. ALOHA_DT_140]
MSDDRKKRIMEHLGLTSNIEFKSSSKNSQSSASKPKPTPTPVRTPPPVKIQPSIKTQPTSAENRKQRIMQHLSQSSKNFNPSVVDEQLRKQQVQAHIRKTRG